MKIEITNPEKIIYPQGKIKKIEIINYYNFISNLMLEIIKNRPVSVIRCHNTVNEENFFKKHPTTEKKLISTFTHQQQELFYIKDKFDIISQAQLGTIEFHNWCSNVKSINKPDMMIFDLDPDENFNLCQLHEAVLKVKKTLDDLNLKSFLKTSGGKGYHIVLPIKCKSWKSLNTFAKQVALLMENQYPNIFTSNIRKTERKNKIFIDYLRNAKGSTCIAPYSLRARKNASISFPIDWAQLTKIKPDEINIINYKNYLIKTNPWESFYSQKQELK